MQINRSPQKCNYFLENYFLFSSSNFPGGIPQLENIPRISVSVLQFVYFKKFKRLKKSDLLFVLIISLTLSHNFCITICFKI